MKKGFTLVELIAVIAIIGVLTVLVVPNVIKIFKTSNDNTMDTQKSYLVDAAKLLVEDYCINPISNDYRKYCYSKNYDSSSVNDDIFNKPKNQNYAYICYSSLKQEKYLDSDYVLEYSGTSCNGMIIFSNLDDSGNIYRYNTVKSYVKCGEAYDDFYETTFGSDYADAYNACISG